MGGLEEEFVQELLLREIVKRQSMEEYSII
jgi:hypothetical protein